MSYFFIFFLFSFLLVLMKYLSFDEDDEVHSAFKKSFGINLSLKPNKNVSRVGNTSFSAPLDPSTIARLIWRRDWRCYMPRRSRSRCKGSGTMGRAPFYVGQDGIRLRG